MNLTDHLEWRYATKKYTKQKVSHENLGQIIRAVNLSASSTGIQPFRLFIVENSELRSELGEGSFNTQIIEASHLIVFAAFEKLTNSEIEQHISHIASVRQIPVEALEPFKTVLFNTILSKTDHENFIWASKQAYLALGTALVAAAELKIDSTPMEGFDAQKFDRLLNLEEQGLKSVVILALGYRDAARDIFASMKKVRVDEKEFARFIK